MYDQFLKFDQPVFTALHSWARFMPEVWKTLAIYGVYLVPVILVYVWFVRKQREIALTAFVAGLVAWQVLNTLVQHLAGARQRPIPFIDLKFPAHEFLFDRPGPSFPSDHTAFLVAITIIFWAKGKRNIAYVIGTITALTMVARVVTAQHWPTDILAGALVGSLAAWLVLRFDKWLQQHVIVPIVSFLKKLHL